MSNFYFLSCFLFLFSFLHAEESENKTFISNSNENEELAIFLTCSYEEILKENFNDAMQFLELAAQILEKRPDPSFEFLLDFGFVIVYDNIEHQKLPHAIENLLGTIEKLKKEFVNTIVQPELDPQNKKADFIVFFETLTLKSRSQEVYEFLSLVLQDIKLDCVDTILTKSELKIKKKPFWGKKGWLKSFEKKVDQIVKTVVKIIKCYKKLDEVMNGTENRKN